MRFLFDVDDGKDHHANMKFIDISGTRFGRLLVKARGGDHIAPNGQPKIKWNCICDCGKETSVFGTALKAGLTKSCGCLKIDAGRRSGLMALRHGAARHGAVTREYRSWRGMLNRCYNPNDTEHYERYGARGIGVCSEWRHSFENFLKDMGYCPKGMTIDRKDNDKGYSKSNCRWATGSEQSRNRACSLFLTIDGESKHLKEWAKIGGISHITLWFRIKYGWETRRAVFEPIHRKPKLIAA